jgi:hypothetical protein
MNVLILNETERNFEIDPPLHWVLGKTDIPEWFKKLLKKQTFTLHSLKLGSNLSVYGNTVQKVNGLQTTQYIHIREGNYTWSDPLLFISFHIDKMDA